LTRAAIRPDVTARPRRTWFLALLANFVVPGSGLILARREWLGLLTALLFGLAAQVAIAGTFLAPAGLPHWLTRVAAAGAAAVWLAAQIALGWRIRWINSPAARSQFDALHQESRDALARGDTKTARAALAGALAIDDEDLDASVELARLLAQTEPRAARRLWRRVAALDSDQRFADETRIQLRQS